MYRLFLPHPHLQPYIDNYWSLRSHVPISQPVSESIFVDGKADILFNFGVPYTRVIPEQGGHIITASNLDGQRSYPVAILQNGAVHLMGVRFKPGGLAAFLPVPAHELSGEVIDPVDTFGAAIRELESRLFDCRADPPGQVHLLDNFFQSRLQPTAAHHLVQHIATHIVQHNTVTVEDLSQQYGYSVRSLNRYFQHNVGFSPKTYIRIVRFQHVLHMLSHDDATSLVEIAFKAGYYDQAHFTRDFKAFTGQTPSAYRLMLHQRRSEPPPNLVQFLQDADPSHR